MRARATLASVVVLFALTAAVVSIAAPPALAAVCGNGQGQPLLLGCTENTATDVTWLARSADGSVALLIQESGSDSTGILSLGNRFGVKGDSDSGTGVFGHTYAENQNGVWGDASNSNGSGVYGENGGTGYGVAGRTTSTSGGTGVLGDAPNGANGIGVEAHSAAGTALKVQGKAVFSRSGIVTVTAGRSSLVVTLGRVTTASMVLATAQQTKAVYVKAVVPAAGSFKIFLTGNAPTGGLKVAYFVLN